MKGETATDIDSDKLDGIIDKLDKITWRLDRFGEGPSQHGWSDSEHGRGGTKCGETKCVDRRDWRHCFLPAWNFFESFEQPTPTSTLLNFSTAPL